MFTSDQIIALDQGQTVEVDGVPYEAQQVDGQTEIIDASEDVVVGLGDSVSDAAANAQPYQ